MSVESRSGYIFQLYWIPNESWDIEMSAVPNGKV